MRVKKGIAKGGQAHPYENEREDKAYPTRRSGPWSPKETKSIKRRCPK